MPRSTPRDSRRMSTGGERTDLLRLSFLLHTGPGAVLSCWFRAAAFVASAAMVAISAAASATDIAAVVVIAAAPVDSGDIFAI